MVTTTDTKATDQAEILEWKNGEVTVIYSEEAGTQIIQHQDSLTDYCSISSNGSLDLLGSDCSSNAGLSSLVSRSSVSLTADRVETGRDQDRQPSIYPESDVNSAEAVNPTLPQLQAFTVLPVNGTLWIPRYNLLHTRCEPKTRVSEALMQQQINLSMMQFKQSIYWHSMLNM